MADGMKMNEKMDSLDGWMFRWFVWLADSMMNGFHFSYMCVQVSICSYTEAML